MTELDTAERGHSSSNGAASAEKHAKLAKRAASASEGVAPAATGGAKKPKRVTPVALAPVAAPVADAAFDPAAAAAAPPHLKTYTWTDVTGKFPYHVVCIATATSPAHAAQLIANTYGPRPLGRPPLIEEIVPLELDSSTPAVRIIDLSEN